MEPFTAETTAVTCVLLCRTWMCRSACPRVHGPTGEQGSRRFLRSSNRRQLHCVVPTVAKSCPDFALTARAVSLTSPSRRAVTWRNALTPAPQNGLFPSEGCSRSFLLAVIRLINHDCQAPGRVKVNRSRRQLYR